MSSPTTASLTRRVAPFTGAWVEIRGSPYRVAMVTVSLPSRERGLKLAMTEKLVVDHVAPFTGAWVEIAVAGRSILAQLSLPSRERGLKFHKELNNDGKNMSLPSRERGLKF